MTESIDYEKKLSEYFTDENLSLAKTLMSKMSVSDFKKIDIYSIIFNLILEKKHKSIEFFFQYKSNLNHFFSLELLLRTVTEGETYLLDMFFKKIPPKNEKKDQDLIIFRITNSAMRSQKIEPIQYLLSNNIMHLQQIHFFLNSIVKGEDNNLIIQRFNNSITAQYLFDIDTVKLNFKDQYFDNFAVIQNQLAKNKIKNF